MSFLGRDRRAVEGDAGVDLEQRLQDTAADEASVARAMDHPPAIDLAERLLDTDRMRLPRPRRTMPRRTARGGTSAAAAPAPAAPPDEATPIAPPDPHVDRLTDLLGAGSVRAAPGGRVGPFPAPSPSSPPSSSQSSRASTTSWRRGGRRSAGRPWCSLAAVLRRTSRTSDYVGRLTTHRFGIILPETTRSPRSTTWSASARRGRPQPALAAGTVRGGIRLGRCAAARDPAGRARPRREAPARRPAQWAPLDGEPAPGRFRGRGRAAVDGPEPPSAGPERPSRRSDRWGCVVSTGPRSPGTRAEVRQASLNRRQIEAPANKQPALALAA